MSTWQNRIKPGLIEIRDSTEPLTAIASVDFSKSFLLL
jgi:hypothetical protein